jgi:hypothetical protein
VANKELGQAIKGIVTLAKAGDLDGAYHGYRDLFAGDVFRNYRPEDQRQALRFMVFMDGAPKTMTPAMVEAHGAAVGPLTNLVSTLGESSDHELLGICHVALGNEESASAIFKAGLAIERERDPQSKLCGALMRRVAAL